MQIKLRKMNGIAEFSDLALGIMTVAIVIAVTLLVLSGFQNSPIIDADANASITALKTEVSNLVSFVGIVVLVVVAAILFSNLQVVRRFAGGFGGRR